MAGARGYVLTLAVFAVALVCGLCSRCALAGKDLDMAIHMGKVNSVRRVLKKGEEGVDDMHGNSVPPKPALVEAIIEGKIDIVKVMIEEFNANVNLKDGSGLTALDAAAFMCDLETLRVIWENGAKDNASRDTASDDGFHWLHRTLWGDENPTLCADAITWMVTEAGADVNVRVTHDSRHGSTALHEAANIGKSRAIHALVDAGADVNAVNEEGNTPLHALCVLAGYYNYIPAAGILVGAGADVTIRNKAGHTALDLLIVAQDAAQKEIDEHSKFKNPLKKPLRVQGEDGKIRTLNPNFIPKSMRVYQTIAKFIDPDTDWSERFPISEEELEREKEHVERANRASGNNQEAEL